MISEIMLYATKIALLVSLAALALERVAAWRGFPRRGIWAAALLLSLALPALGLLARRPMMPTPSAGSHSVSSVAAPRIAAVEIRAPDTAAAAAITPHPLQPYSTRPGRALLEQALLTVWLTGSAGWVAFYVLASLRLRVAARGWRREQLHGHPVWVTEALGPGVCGLIRPVILIPHWVLDSPLKVRSLVLAHEREHVVACDPALLLSGLMLVAVAPWNLLLWWQLSRLRFAIEVDCDARVLRGGEDPTVYGRVLLTVGERRTSMPVGAIALTEPASQLLRRVRVMTSEPPRRGTPAAAGAVGLSLASLALAADFQAPALQAAWSSRGLTAVELRKPPPGTDPRPAAAENLVRSVYPELFNASAPAHPVLVTLLLNQDGTLYKSFKEDTGPKPWVARSDPGALGDDREYSAGVKLRMNGSPTAGNYVDVRTWYRAPIRDPRRDVATVRRKVRARYASLFRPVYADGSHGLRDGISVVTVFMTESGEIDRAQTEVTPGVVADWDADAELERLATPERFAAMGVARERIGPIGTTQLYSGHLDERDSRTLLVIYAWPRRAGEPGATHEPARRAPAAAADDDPAVDRAIAERCFPDLYSFPKAWPRADPWVLLDRQGRVQKSGRRVVDSGRDIQLYVESLYPGIRTDEVQVTTVRGRPGQWAAVGFVWLAADSPVTDPSRVDLSERDAVLVYADIIGEGMTRPTGLLKLQAGSPQVAAGSLMNPFGVVYVQVTAVEIQADALTARIRVQHMSLQATGEAPPALEAAWSRPSAPVRAPYGGSADVQVPDQNGESWRIVLHPDRIGPGGA